MSNFDKKLDKAENYFKKKHYKEALRICDKVLEKQYNNEKALELEGEILYRLGRVDEAILNWKINSEYNNNPTSKMRLAEMDKSTKEKALSYDNFNTISSDTLQAELAIILAAQEKEAQEKEAQKIKEATEDIKIDEPTSEVVTEEKPIEVVEEIISNDKENVISEVAVDESSNTEPEIEVSEVKVVEPENNKTSINNENNSTVSEENVQSTDKKQTVNPKKTSSKNRNIAIAVACVVVIAAASYGVYKYSSKTDDTIKPQTEVTEQTKELPANFNESLTKATDSKDFDNLYSLLSDAKGLKIPAEDQKSYDAALKLMQTDGIQKFYDAGLDQMKEKKYQDALGNLTKAYDFCGGSYLEPHIMYFMGAANAGLNKPEDAVKYYKEYLEKFPHADMYTPEVLYKLAEYYNGTGDKDQAKKYAQHIENSYPSSPYYNDTLKDILYK